MSGLSWIARGTGGGLRAGEWSMRVRRGRFRQVIEAAWASHLQRARSLFGRPEPEECRKKRSAQEEGGR